MCQWHRVCGTASAAWGCGSVPQCVWHTQSTSMHTVWWLGATPPYDAHWHVLGTVYYMYIHSMYPRTAMPL